MDTLLHVGFSNAVLATGLAALAAGVTCVCRRPALAHALWLLVLLKLLTPPLVPIPVPWFARSSSPEDRVEATLPVGELLFNRAGLPEEPAGDVAEAASQDQPEAQSEQVFAGPSSVDPSTDLGPPSLVSRFSWEPVLLALWLTGSAVWCAAVALRMCQFRRLLRHAVPAPAHVQGRGQALARRLGVARCPPIAFLPFAASPMLWAFFGSRRLLLPEALWQRLTDEQRDAVLVHELAHLRRRDHWVRYLELLALGLYWWHPVAWWVRRQLHETEEQCCDAWVIWALPEGAEAYTQALVGAVALLSRPWTALPVGASGMGHVRLLKRRLDMILEGKTAKSLSRSGRLVVLGIGILLLPLATTGAQNEQPPRVEGTAPDPGPMPPPAPSGPALPPVPHRAGSSDDLEAPSPPPTPSGGDLTPVAPKVSVREQSKAPSPPPPSSPDRPLPPVSPSDASAVPAPASPERPLPAATGLPPALSGSDPAVTPPPPAIGDKAPQESPVLWVKSRRIRLNYEIRGAGPSGIGAVEVWYTRDSRVWRRFGDAPPKPPFIVEVREEGRHGFTMVARSGAGRGPQAPQAGHQPQVWIEVDVTPPRLELYAPEVCRGPDGASLVIKWQATDKNLAARPITLFYAEQADGPWTRLADDLGNTGRCECVVPRGMPTRVWLRARAADRAGNVTFATMGKPIIVDAAEPEAVILGAEAATEKKESPPDVSISNDRNFKIPITVDPSARGNVKEVLLFASADEGRTWNQQATTSPDRDAFNFYAPADGHYWFQVVVVDQHGRRTPADVTKSAPALKVRVATTK
jgi:beta-lactamase regulating signal transducer with metallopeptidase domain